VIVWSYFIENNLDLLVKLEGKIIATIYVNVLENYLLLFIGSLDNYENYFF